MVSLARRSFLRAKPNADVSFIRPPWALQEKLFVESCTRCNKCINACPTEIIVAGSGGFPHIDFNKGYCTFCQECVAVCDENALFIDFDESSTKPQPNNEELMSLAWTIKPEIESSCMAYNKVECRVCAEACDYEAIRFVPTLGGVSSPKIDMDVCVGCGACVLPCPTSAIKLKDGLYAGS